jgi:hypothetical protein
LTACSKGWGGVAKVVDSGGGVISGLLNEP